jgi:hypothetical protein
MCKRTVNVKQSSSKCPSGLARLSRFVRPKAIVVHVNAILVHDERDSACRRNTYQRGNESFVEPSISFESVERGDGRGAVAANESGAWCVQKRKGWKRGLRV